MYTGVVKIILAAGTGFIGAALRRSLEAAGHEVIVLTRRLHALPLGVRAAHWDGRTVKGWAGKLEGADAVINLAGATIARRWTPAAKQEILLSRVESTRALVGAMGQCLRKPQVLVNASAVGYYGDGGEAALSEDSPSGEGFLARVCRAWEEEALRAQALGARVACLRLGVVLGPGGGVLARMALPFLFFAGGPLGSGRQWLSWIHREDAIGVIERALWDRALSGPINVCSPEPARMEHFCSELGHVLRRPSWVRVPTFGLRLLMGEAADVVLLSERVLPKKLESGGYIFKHSGLREALEAIFVRRRRSRKAPPAGVPSRNNR